MTVGELVCLDSVGEPVCLDSVPRSNRNMLQAEMSKIRDSRYTLVKLTESLLSELRRRILTKSILRPVILFFSNAQYF